MIIKILGMGCANCKRTKALTQEVVNSLRLTAQIEEVTDLATIMGYGVMATPAIVINEQVVSTGGVPSREQLVKLLQPAQAS